MSYIPEIAWRRLYEVDFTAEPSAGPFGNGPQVIDGKTWTVENAANAASIETQIGTGLIITPLAGGANYGDGQRTAPLLRTSLDELVGNVQFGTVRAWRLVARVLLTNADQDFKFAKAGFEWSTTPQNFNALHGRGFSSGGGGISTQAQLNTSATSVRTPAVLSGDEVLELIWRPHFSFDYRIGATFPPSSSSFIGSLMGTMSANVATAFGTGEMRVVLAAQPTGAPSQFTATFTQLALYGRL